MNAYFQYLKDMIIAFFSNLGHWFNDRFARPWARVPGEFDDYRSIFSMYSGQFDFPGWFFYVLFWILAIGLVGAILYGIGYLIYRYVKFYKKQADTDKLLHQIEQLNFELYQALTEKDRILGLSFTKGIAGPEGEEEEEGKTPEGGEIRFPRLAQIDQQYATPLPPTRLPEDATDITLSGICERFRNFACSQMHLYYTIEQCRVFFAGMGTGKIIILEGISGTGKTSLPYCLGRFFRKNAVICSVQPSWHDRSELLGYYNDFTHRFTETVFLSAIYEATFRDDINLVVLDEMNLARIEYYFAEFLSIMEMRDVEDWVIDLIPSMMPGDPAHLKDGKLVIPQNILFFGTANNDDSTFTIADKVYDRAISLFFDDKGRPFEFVDAEPMVVPYAQLTQLFDEAKKQYPVSESMTSKFEQLDNFVITKFRLAFGNRILKQLEDFIPVFVGCGGTEVDGFDFIFTNKVLKKFEALNLAFLKDALKELDAFLDKLYGKGNFPMAHATIDNLQRNN